MLKDETKIEKALLNLDEFCEYLGIGQTKAREILTKTNNPYTVRIGNRLYANKFLLDKWLNTVSGNKVSR
ncbi:transposase [Anaerocolumna aminovalerica]|uniref:transposase n=1 Tax=Anaerocolumna aminovalerica TaxID=1527 RepID=UPI000BE36A9F|nr:transposase [Anaerocolumna aminovalerica]